MSFRNRLSAERSALRLAVDPISNTVAITQANPLYAPSQTGPSSLLESDWGKALADGALAHNLLAPILHELTHHSSLQTPVGISLSALAVSHTSVFGETYKDAEQLVGPARDRVLYTAANLYLKPLLEGMSLFQEFDAVSGAVPLSTWATQVATALFTGKDVLGALLANKDICSPLKSKLEALRLLPDFVSRKRDLLRSALEDGQGYLLGYLLVKMIWGDQTTRNKAWRHTDLFLMFINDYFFSDFFLALLLVRRPIQPLELDLEDLKDYLVYRLLNLSKNAHTFGKEFLEYYLKEGTGRPSYQRFSESVKSTLDFEWSRRTLRNVHYATPDFISGRTHPRVLAAAATVSIDEAGRFKATFADGSPPFHGPALNAARPVSGGATQADGSVEAVVLLPQNGRRTMRIVICTFLDKELVATFDPKTREFNDNDAASACDRLGSYLSYESFAMQVDAELPTVVKGGRLAKCLEQYSGAGGIERMIEIWGRFALIPDVDKDEIDNVAELLKADGLRGPLQLNAFSLGRLARLSLCPLQPEQPLEPLSAEDEQWIGELNTRSREFLGFALLVLQERKVHSSRI
jgi:hypothetical protein